jgi:hypothetical protein
MSTRFCCRNGSRLAETASTNSMSSADAELGGDDLGDLDVEALRLAGQALEAEQRLVELGADPELCRRRPARPSGARLEVGLLDRGRGVVPSPSSSRRRRRSS